MKEAAYKAHQRKFELPRCLNWKTQKCKLLELTPESAKGSVKIGDQIYLTRSDLTPESIHTMAYPKKKARLIHHFTEGSSLEVREALMKDLASFFLLDPKRLRIVKNEDGIPIVMLDHMRFFSKFSLSGHGRFSAYFYSLTQS